MTRDEIEKKALEYMQGQLRHDASDLVKIYSHMDYTAGYLAGRDDALEEAALKCQAFFEKADVCTCTHAYAAYTAETIRALKGEEK